MKTSSAAGKFLTLLQPLGGETPGETQSRARDDFLATAMGVGFGVRRQGGERAAAERTIVIGVASYSRPELGLLDRLGRAAVSQRAVCVFDAGAIRHADDFEEFLPGFGPVFRTPLMGVYRSGKLTDAAQGQAEVEDLLERFGLLSPGASA